jgi:DNA/RNA endonuclease G (NUC1)
MSTKFNILQYNDETAIITKGFSSKEQAYNWAFINIPENTWKVLITPLEKAIITVENM